MKKLDEHIGCKSLIGTIAVLLLLLSGPAVSNEISLSSRIDRSDIAFEDEINLDVEIKWQGNIGSYLFERLPVPETENLKIVGTKKSISSSEENGLEYTTRIFQYTFEPTLSGSGAIKPITLKYVTWPDSIPGELSSQEFRILIAAPIPKAEPGRFPFWIVYLITAVVIIGAVVFILLAKKKSAPVEPTKKPEEIFLEELKIARKESGGDRQQFFTRLYKILMAFIEARYGLQTTGKITEAIVKEFNELEIPLDYKEQISGYLICSDTEKFAPGQGEPGDIIRLSAEIEKLFKNIINRDIAEAK